MMKKWDKDKKGSVFNDEQREHIKDTLFKIFEDNQVSVVEMKNGEMKPYAIWVYTLRKAKVK